MGTDTEKEGVAMTGERRERYRRVVEKLRQFMRDSVADVQGEVGDELRAVIEFRIALSDETDRGAALMAAAFIDDRLKILLERKLVAAPKIVSPIFEFNGALGTFSSRIDMAYLLGLLPKNARQDLHAIRKIRNEFAHTASPISFDDERVAGKCNALKFHGVREAAEPGSKFRRSAMGLMVVITEATIKAERIEARPDCAIQDRTEAYEMVSKIVTDITGEEYLLKHEHEE
ncbi:MltR family transcriptional regulator [Ralstonia nicotianae]